MDFPSNWQNEGLFSEYLRLHAHSCLYDVDMPLPYLFVTMKGVLRRADYPMEDIWANYLKQDLPTDQVMSLQNGKHKR